MFVSKKSLLTEKIKNIFNQILEKWDMNNEELVYLTIKFIDGSEQKFTFPRQSDGVDTVTDINEAVDKNYLLVEIEDKTLIFPIQSILYCAVSPSPSQLPSHTIKNAKRVKKTMV